MAEEDGVTAMPAAAPAPASISDLDSAFTYFKSRVALQQGQRQKMERAKAREARKAARGRSFKGRKSPPPRVSTTPSPMSSIYQARSVSPFHSPTAGGQSSPHTPLSPAHQQLLGEPLMLTVCDQRSEQGSDIAPDSAMTLASGAPSFTTSQPPARGDARQIRRRRATQKIAAMHRQQITEEELEEKKIRQEQWSWAVEKAKRSYKRYNQLNRESDSHFIKSLNKERSDALAKLQEKVYGRESTGRYRLRDAEEREFREMLGEYTAMSRAVALQVVKNKIDQAERIDQSQFKHGLQVTIETQIRRIAEAKNFEYLRKEARRREKERGQGLPLPVMTRVQEKTIMRCLLTLEKNRDGWEREKKLAALRTDLHRELLAKEGEHLQRSIATRERNVRVHRVRDDVARVQARQHGGGGDDATAHSGPP